MGFSIQSVVIVYWLRENHLLETNDSVLELGSQQVNNDVIERLESLDGLAKLFGVPPFSTTFDWKMKDPKYLKSGMQELPEDAPLAQKLYEHLKLKYACVDLDGNPHSIKLDLNYDVVPQEHQRKYSLVTNLGTTEHVANQLNAFKAIHDFTASGGVMVHSLPFQGFETHGLVNYTMKFFWYLIRSNMYRVIDADISAWNKAPIPAGIVDFTKENSRIFKSKEHVEKLEMQDAGITMVLQKIHDMEFVPPLDLADESRVEDPVLKKRYWTVLDRNSSRMRALRIKNFIKNIFRF